jgi:hypothetical protein
VGGLTSSGATYKIDNCNITCENFISARGANTLQITNSTIKATGNSHFVNGDSGGTFDVLASNCTIQTNCTFLNQLGVNANSIFNAISNKPTDGTFNGLLQAILTLNIV